ncbi:hypothetical protein D3C72_1182030 [compost metagenome]
MKTRVFPFARCAVAFGVALLIGGCYQTAGMPVGASLPQLQAEDAAFRNAWVVSNMRTLQMALEEHAVDNQGRYPAPGELLTALGRNGYLPGDRLPSNPWAAADGHQANELSTAGLQPALTPAGQPPTAAGTPLGSGHVAAGDVYDGLTYGALVYDFDPKTQIYTLYAIGKQGDHAAVIASATNQ